MSDKHLTLTPENVAAIVIDCLFDEKVVPNKKREEWAKKHGVEASGITRRLYFDENKVKKNKEIILTWVNRLLYKFDDGYTFIALGHLEGGGTWTQSHWAMEDLLVLGIAVGCLKIISPKTSWESLPAGLPYVQRVKYIPLSEDKNLQTQGQVDDSF